MDGNAGYRLWLKELKEPTPEERRQDRTTEGNLMLGFWRSIGPRLGYDLPVAIYMHQGEVAFQRGTFVNTVRRNADMWQAFLEKGWLKSVAVKEDDWRQAVATGFWADGKPARAMTDEEKHGIDIPDGANAERGELEETLADQIKSLADLINGMAKPTNADEAALLANRLDKMKILLDKAEATRVAEKEPHLTAGREIDAKWKAIGEPGGDAWRRGKELRTQWLKDEDARLKREAAEATRKAQEEADREHRERVLAYNIRVDQWRENNEKWLAETPEETDRRLELEAENIHLGNSWLGRSEVPIETIKANLLEWDAKLRAEAQAAAEAAAATGQNEPVIPAVLLAQAPPPEPPKVAEVVPEKAKISGAYGRSKSLKKVKRGKITDMAKFLSNCAGNDKFKELAQQHANALARTGTAIDGMEIEEVYE